MNCYSNNQETSFEQTDSLTYLASDNTPTIGQLAPNDGTFSNADGASEHIITGGTAMGSSIPHSSSFTVNLSNYVLNENEISLLDKGLTFIPTYGRFPTQTIYLLQQRLIRNLKLKDFFSDSEDSDADWSVRHFEPPSTWTPSDSLISASTLKTIQAIVNDTENILSDCLSRDRQYLHLRNRQYNIDSGEKLALSTLRNNCDIVIKPADKGSATVIMNKDSYLQEAYRQLYNVNYYQRLPVPIFRDNSHKINAILTDMHNQNLITDKQLVYLTSHQDARVRKFYLLPKIHKDKEKWPQPGKMPEGRPIVSDTGSESYAVSQYIDYYLKPISKLHPSYLRDTYDFVSKVRGRALPREAFLVTGDVTSLYPNMKIDRILETVKQAFIKHPLPGRPDNHLLQLLEITLRGNDFEFNEEHFLQICGTAMGKTYAPSLADIYLEEFDEKANTGFWVRPLLFFRFIDDIFFVWCGTEQQLIEYNNFLNNLIPGIKVTLAWSKTDVNFLDTVLYRLQGDGGDVIGTKTYFKSTDTHQLLHPKSYHPRHTCRGVLKSQFIRFRRISTTRADYDEASNILMQALALRSYSKRLMRRLKSEVWNNYTSDPIPRAKSKDPILPIVVPYNQIGTQLARKWRSQIAGSTTFANHKLITAYTVGKNLRASLVRATIPTSGHNAPTTRPTATFSNKNECKQCTNTRCKACNYVHDARVFKSTHNGKTFQVRGQINCKSHNLVYLITCRLCSAQYVGETSRTLGERITDHTSAIRLKKPTPVGLHFNGPGHTLQHFSVTGIEKFPDNCAALTRKTKESVWQTLLQTAFPLGINNLRPKHQQHRRLSL